MRDPLGSEASSARFESANECLLLEQNQTPKVGASETLLELGDGPDLVT